MQEPPCSCISVDCAAETRSNQNAVPAPCTIQYTEWIKLLNNTHISHCSVLRSKVTAWTEDYPHCLFPSHSHFPLSFLALPRRFYNLLICLLPEILLFHPVLYSTSLPLVYVESEGWDISSVCNILQWPSITQSVHFSEVGESNQFAICVHNIIIC